MASLLHEVSDLDLITIGLAGAWDTPPAWLQGALERMWTERPDQLLATCRVRHQLGLLQSTLEFVTLQRVADDRHKYILDAYTRADELNTAALLRSIYEIDYVFSGIGLPFTLLKGATVGPRYYRRSRDRKLCDIDILVDEVSAIRAQSALSRLGFVHGQYKDDQQRIVEHDAPIAAGSASHYQLLPMTKLVPVEIDASIREILVELVQQPLRVRTDSCEAIVTVEVHYALDAERRLPVELEQSNLEFAPHAMTLTAATEFVYLCFKAYIDLILFHKPQSVKLVADAMRVLDCSARSNLLAEIELVARGRGLGRMLSYFFRHARDTFYVRRDLPERDIGWTVSGRDVLDFGDFLPWLLNEQCVSFRWAADRG